MIAPKTTITVDQLAALSGISRDAIYDAVQFGKCDVPHLRAGRRIVFPIPGVCAALGLTPAHLVALGLIAPEAAALFTSPTPGPATSAEGFFEPVTSVPPIRASDTKLGQEGGISVEGAMEGARRPAGLPIGRPAHSDRGVVGGAIGPRSAEGREQRAAVAALPHDRGAAKSRRAS